MTRLDRLFCAAVLCFACFVAGCLYAAHFAFMAPRLSQEPPDAAQLELDRKSWRLQEKLKGK